MNPSRLAAIAIAFLCGMPAASGAENFSDIWWNPNESGWGVTIADHDTNVFAVLYHYTAQGQPAWWVIPGGTFSQGRRIFQGDVYSTSGPPYTSAVFNASDVTVTKVGSATFDFAPSGLAAGTILFSYAIGGVSRTKQLQRQPFGNANASWGTDWTDLWYNPAQSGWGLSLSQHGNNVFGVWYTYDAARNPLWLVIPGGTLASATFSGKMYQTTGPGIGADPFDPSKVAVSEVGTATVSLASGTAMAPASVLKSGGDFTPCIRGSCFRLLVQRQPFGSLAPQPVAGTCAGTYTASIDFPLCPGGFTAHANGLAFSTDGVDYNRQGAFAGIARFALPNVFVDRTCYQQGTIDAATAFNGSMDLSRIGQADFIAPYGDFAVAVHAQFSVGTSTVLGTLTGPGVSGRFSCTF